jgi:hypothetical protein
LSEVSEASITIVSATSRKAFEEKLLKSIGRRHLLRRGETIQTPQTDLKHFSREGKDDREGNERSTQKDRREEGAQRGSKKAAAAPSSSSPPAAAASATGPC